jgi:hypothetical protein
VASPNQPYKIAKNASGHYDVIGPDGGIRGTYKYHSAAESLADSLNSSVSVTPNQADVEILARPLPKGFSNQAFSVSPLQDVFVARDARGFHTGEFATEAEAIHAAAENRRKYEKHVEDLASGKIPPGSTTAGSGRSKSPLSTPPPPMPVAPGQKGFVGPLAESFYSTPPPPMPVAPGQKGFIGPLPASFYSQPPTPWVPSPGQPGFIGPMPAPPPGPTPWIPSPGQPGFVGPLPASMAKQAPTPWIPSPGQPGFIGPMPAPAAPPVPAPRAPGQYGFIGPLPQTSKDLMDSLRKALDSATGGMPHANGGRFDWQKIGHGIAQGLTSVGSSSPTSGLPQSVINAGSIGAAIAKGFSREIGIIGGMATVSEGLGRFAENVNESNRRLAPFSGRIATAFTQLDFGDFRRDFRMGAATADTATRLAQSIDASRDAWMNVEILQSNISNRIGIFGSEISRIDGNVLGMPASVANYALEQVDPNGQTSSLLGRAAGIAKWGLWGAGMGRIFGPWGALAGGVGGLAAGAVADQMETPKDKSDPWGDFFTDARNLGVLRPPRVVVP